MVSDDGMFIGRHIAYLFEIEYKVTNIFRQLQAFEDLFFLDLLFFLFLTNKQTNNHKQYPQPLT